MPSKSQKSKLSTPKTHSLSSKAGISRKRSSQPGSEANSRCSTPNSNASSRSTSRSSSRLQKKSKKPLTTTSSKFLTNIDSDYEREYDGEYIYGSDLEVPSDAEEDEPLAPSDEEFRLDDDEPIAECDDDEEDDWSETSSVSRQKPCPARPPTPEFLQVPEEEIPALSLPSSSTDLPILGCDLMQVIAIYEVIRHYSRLLRISPCRFEDFCASLTSDEQCALISEIYTSLMKALMREEEGNQTWYGAPDMKDSINIGFFFLDAMSWYECTRSCLESDKYAGDYSSALSALSKESYFATTLKERLVILQCLTDLFLSSNAVREDILKEGNIRYDEHCRYCHKLGDLLCCETCPAVYHLECVDPPLSAVPDDDWHCSVCINHQLEGVGNCKPLSEINGFSIRHEPIGMDRHKRRYWFLARRIIVEGEEEVLYYSTKQAFDELLEKLDGEKWERSLVREFDYVRDEIHRQMAVTADLTNRLKADRKSALEVESEQLQKIQDARAEKRKQEEEERRKREEEEARKKEEEERLRREKEQEEQRKLEELQEKERKEREEKRREESDQIVEQQDVTESIKRSQASSMTSTTVSERNVVQTAGGALRETSVEEMTVTKTVTETTTTRTTVTRESPSNEETQAPPDKPKGQTIVMKNQDGTLTHITVFTQPNQQIQNLLSSMKTGSSDAKPNVIQLKTNTSGGVAPAVINLSAVAVNDKPQITNITTNVPKSAPINISVAAVNDSAVKSDGAPVVPKPAPVAPVEEVKVDSGESKSESETQSQSKTEKTEEVTTTTESSEATTETRRISTRLKTGSLVPKFMDDYVTATKGSLVKAAAKMQSETVSTETVSRDNVETVRMTRSRTQAVAMGVNQSDLFRLGEEGNYKSYTNEYSVNALALNKQQHGEERDKKRQLSHKFSLTAVSEFKWSGSIHGTKQLTLATLREGLKLLENSIPPHFMHPAWSTFRNGWNRYVGACSHPQQFANALCKLELVIKPVLFNHSWHESLGHWRLKRLTLAEREEQRKKDREAEKLAKKKDKEEEDVDRSRWCKYTLGLKHQVYKQKGEEYRVVGGDGWMWHSVTRVHKVLPQDQCGLRALAKKIQAKRRQAIEAKIEEHLARLKDANDDDSDDESSVRSGEQPKPESIDVTEKCADVTKADTDIKGEMEGMGAKECEIKTEVSPSAEVKQEPQEKDTKPPKIVLSNEPSTNVKLEAKIETDAEVKSEEGFSTAGAGGGISQRPVHSAVKRVLESFDPTPQKKAKTDDTDSETGGQRVSSPIEISDDETSQKRHSSPIVIASDDGDDVKPEVTELTAERQSTQASEVKNESKVETGLSEASESKPQHVGKDVQEAMDTDDVKSEKGSESTASAKSEVFELDDVKTDVLSEGSRSKTVTPKPEADDNSLDIDSAAIEKMLTKQAKFDHVLDVSDALLKRNHYPRVNKPYSKLDHLLDRRQKQWKVEMQQKQILDAVLLRCRVQTIQKKKFLQELEEKRRKEREMTDKEKGNASFPDECKEKQAGDEKKEERQRSDSETDSDIELNAEADDSNTSGLHKVNKTKGDEEEPVIDEMDMSDIGMGKSQIELSVMGQYQCYSASCRADDSYQCYSVLCNLYKQKAENREQDDDSLNEEPISGDFTESGSNLVNSQSSEPDEILDPVTGEIRKNEKKLGEPETDVTKQGTKHAAKPAEDASEKPSVEAAEGTGQGRPPDTAATSAADIAPGKEESLDVKNADSTGAESDMGARDRENETCSEQTKNSGETSKSPEKKKLEKAAEVKAIQEKYSIQQKDGNTFIMYGERFKVIEQSEEELDKKAKKTFTSYDALNLTNFTHAGKLSLPPIAIPDLEVKSFMCGKTKYKFVLLKHHHRGRGMARSRLMLRKGCIPNIHRFCTPQGRSSILILERFELRTLARNAGKREVNSFKYDCKMNNVLWPYPCPRPRMKTCWRYRTRCPPNLAAIALQVRILWASLRWDDLAMKAPQSGENTVTTEEEIRKKEIVDRREVGAHGLRSQFLVREIIIPLNIVEEPKRDYTPIRSGLRERKRPESPKVRKPLQTEKWINEEALDLWEIKRYYEKEDQARLAKQEEQKRKEEAKRPDEVLTEQLELKKQRQEAQQKRLAAAADQTGQKENDHRPHIIRHYLPSSKTQQNVVRVVPSTQGSGSVLKMTQVQTPSGTASKVLQPKSILPAISKASGQTDTTSGNVALRPKVLGAAGISNTPNVVPTKTTIAQIKPNTPGGNIQNLRIMQLPDGGYHVEGLQPGQQLVKLPGGRFQVITPRRPPAPQVSQPTATVNRQIRPAPTVSTPPATRVVRMQTPSGVVVKTLAVAGQQDATATPQKITSPPARVITTPQNTQEQPKTQIQAAVQPKAQLVQIQLPGQPPRQVLLSGEQLAQLQTLQAQGKVNLNNLQGSLSQSVSGVTTQRASQTTPAKATQKLGATSPTSVTSQSGLSTPQASGGLVLVRTPTGQLAYVRQGQATQGVMSPPILGAAQLINAPLGGSPPAGSVSSSVVQQMLQQAMQSSEDPEIQAKIAKLQRKMGTPETTVKSARRSFDLAEGRLDASERQTSPGQRQHTGDRTRSAVTSRTKSRLPRSREDMEERAIDRKEARLQRKMAVGAVASEKKERARSTTLVTSLQRQKDALKSDMMRKRALMEKTLQQQVQAEIDGILERSKPPEKERKRKQKAQEPKETKKRRKSSECDVALLSPQRPHATPQRSHATPKVKAKAVSPQQKQQPPSRTPPTAPQPEVGMSPEDRGMSARKRHKLASASRAKERGQSSRLGNSQLYCICKTPYDDTKFYVGCDLCSNWFHGSCIGIAENQATEIDSYICDECRKAKEDTDEELYCLCRKPYDDKQFYVGCDGCQDWFHAPCVGITREEAEQLDAFWCPACEKDKQRDDQFNGRLIQRHHWELLKQVWSNVKAHKMSWPFLQPVDPDEVPDYYDIITNPMDLKTIKQKLDKRLYRTIGEFSKDMFLMFNNCRIYNPPTSPFFQCAEVLEIFFDKKQLTVLKSKL